MSLSRGLGRPLAGWRFLSDRPDLRRLAFGPIAVLAVLLLVGLALALSTTGPWLASLVDYRGQAGIAGGLLRVLDALWSPVAYVVALMLSALGAWVLSRTIAEPMYDALSQRVDAAAGGSAPDAPEGLSAIVTDALRGISHTAAGLTVWAAVSCGLLGLNVVPVVGSALDAAGSWGVAAFLLSLEALDFPLSRRRFAYLDKLKWAWARRWEAVGFGSAMALGLLIPGANFVLLPAAIAAATLWVVEEERAQRGEQGEVRSGPRQLAERLR